MQPPKEESVVTLAAPQTLVIGVSSRSLFKLEAENEIYERQGVEAYRAYQREREDVPLEPGPGFPLVQALLSLNQPEDRRVDVVVMSRNSPDTGLRVLNSVRHHGLDIRRSAFAGGAPQAPYLGAYNVDLFLSRDGADVQSAIDAGFAAAQIYELPQNFPSISSAPNASVAQNSITQGPIRIAFDGDAVLFSDESEARYQREGLGAFSEYERQHAHIPMDPGPFSRFLLTLSWIQKHRPGAVRIALVTARGGPAHERVIRTLRAWNVDVDEAFFLGGEKRKAQVLQAFGAHIFFDDQDVHLDSTKEVVPSAKVPYRRGSALRRSA